MGPRAHVIFILITYISGNLGYLPTSKEEVTARKFTARNEVENFVQNLSVFGEEYGQSWMVLPNGEGISQFALLEPHLSRDAEERFFTSYNLSQMPQLVKMFSYTKESRDGVEIDPENLQLYDFDSSKPTKIICHGWMASANSSVITGIRDAYLDNQDVNVIGVDWSQITKDYIYPNAAGATDVVGKYVGSVIDRLVREKKARYNNFHLIGHSLGAHVSGFAGHNTKQKVGRITGLDPALPGFQFTKGPNDRLDPSDANFVDVIHTCAGVLGMSISAGHVDFYPNGGSPFQPGCNINKLLTSTQACSHGRSHQYFAESIRHSDFKAVGCSDWDHFKNNKCKNVYTSMGEYTSSKVRGPFYLKTNNDPPFALGMNGTFFE